MPAASEYGIGLRSVTIPTTGCSSEAVSWNASVISPISPKSSERLVFSIGYSAGISDCMVSLSMCETDSASRMVNAALSAAMIGAPAVATCFCIELPRAVARTAVQYGQRSGGDQLSFARARATLACAPRAGTRPRICPGAAPPLWSGRLAPRTQTDGGAPILEDVSG